VIVCVCHRVSHLAIAACAQRPGASFESMQEELRVATACGACENCARDTFLSSAALAQGQALGPTYVLAQAPMPSVHEPRPSRLLLNPA
jgi:bacterioferritin-associated ferredoxin